MDQARFFEWLQPYYYPTHKYTILAYVFSGLLMAGLFIFTFILLRHEKKQKFISARVFPGIYILDLLYIVYMLVLKPDMIRLSIFTIVVWVVLLFLPFFDIFLSKTSEIFVKKLSFVLFIGVCTEFFLLFGPLSSKNIFLLNEYFDIPSQTYLQGETYGALRIVDNHQYINREKLWGNHLRYDIRIDKGEDPECLEGNFIDTDSKLLGRLVELYKYSFYFHYPTDKICFVGPMSPDLFNQVKLMLPAEEWNKIDDTYNKNQIFYYESRMKPINKENIDFIRKNEFELRQTVHDLELTFHHHFQFLFPIHELALDRPMNEIVALYGTNFIFLKKFLDLLGGVTYESFLHLMFASYILYYIFFVIFLFTALRDIRYITFVLLITFSSIKGLGFITLFTGLSYTPIRHFLDVFVFILFYKYTRTENSKFLLLALIVSELGLLGDRFVGSFLIVALLATISVRLLFGHASNKRFEIAILAIGIISFISLFFLLGNVTAKSPYTKGFVEGVWGFPIPFHEAALVLLGFVSGYGLLILAFSNYFKNVYYFPLMLVFYIQLYFIYWAIVPNYGHLYVIYPFIAIAIGFFMKLIIEPMISWKKTQLLVILLLGAAVLYSLFTSGKIWNSYADYNKVAQDHVVHDWKFPNMRVQSSMDPQFFAGASNLIKKYSPGKKGIHILSKYDTLLMFLSNKYSLMPHFEIATYINNHETFKAVLDKIEQDKPEIIFVDTDIRRNQITAKQTNPKLQALPTVYIPRIEQKIDRLTWIKKIFERIDYLYEKIEETELISIYRRR